MRPSVLLGLSAFIASSLAQSIETVVSANLVTITSCGPEVTNCPARATPSVSSSLTTITKSSAEEAANSSTEAVSAAASSTRSYPMSNSTTTAKTLTAAASTSSSNLSRTAVPSFTDSTMTAAASAAMTNILTASGTPTIPATTRGINTVTSMVVVTPSAPITNSDAAASSSTASQNGSNRIVTPRFVYAVLALAVWLLC